MGDFTLMAILFVNTRSPLRASAHVTRRECSPHATLIQVHSIVSESISISPTETNIVWSLGKKESCALGLIASSRQLCQHRSWSSLFGWLVVVGWC
jgi:hypothetical protein